MDEEIVSVKSDICGCCESGRTECCVQNRPRLSAIAYRAGTQGSFKAEMLRSLSASDRIALTGLKTRSDDDFSIAFLDAWAGISDILTFYQERIASESYLRTATERLSALQLTRLIGYELRPGVAASTYLAFTLENAPGAPSQVTIDKGTKVQSIPGQDEKPQVFETVEKIVARPEWNELRPRQTRPQNLLNGVSEIYLSGNENNIKKGDVIMISSFSFAAAAHIRDVAVENNLTHLTLEAEIGPLPYIGQPAMFIDANRKVPLDAASVFACIQQARWADSDLNAFLTFNEWDPDALVAYLVNDRTEHPAVAGSACILSARAGIFGNNAPKWDSLPASQRYGEWVYYDSSGYRPQFINAAYPKEWDDSNKITTDSQGITLIGVDFYLDRSMPSLSTDGFVVLEEKGKDLACCRIDKIIETSLSDYAISAKVTGLSVAVLGSQNLSAFTVRGATVYIQSERLAVAEEPLMVDLAAGESQLELDTLVLGLRSGQTILLRGERSDAEGLIQNEILTIKEITHDYGLTTLFFETGLSYSYKRKTLIINANIALATHGETLKEEVLGSGDATKAYQRFTLKQSPLTFTGADNPDGGESTLEIYVNNIKWKEIPALYGCGPRDRVFISRIDDTGKTTVQFGDGETGSRLPSGNENVRAVYRKGIGREGEIKAEQLSLLMTRPLGVKSVKNPVAASGAQDGETREEASDKAPATVRTLDRVVSLKDYEDFALSFKGIAKALAIWAWSRNAHARGIFMTVAGTYGEEVKEGGKLYENLLSAILKAGDPYVPVLVKPCKIVPFKVRAEINVKANHKAALVIKDVKNVLNSYFSFDARKLGQAVAKSEVISLIQNIPGVDFFDVRLENADSGYVAAYVPESGKDEADLKPAELLVIDPSSLDDIKEKK